jgi:hypothetical protein
MSESDELAHLATRSADELDAWLRGQLSRQAVALVLVPVVERAMAEAWSTRFGGYRELRMVVRGVGEAPHALAEALAEAASLDPDVVLIWLADGAVAGVEWARAALAGIEDVGARDRWLCLLVGPEATRALARQLGYEDGLPLEIPVGEVAALLARAAATNDGFRRGGSSPPCYLR